MATSTVSVRFTLNFANKTIVGTKASFDKAGKGYGPVYEELADKLARHPDFVCVLKEPKKPAKPKQTYKGMDVPFIRDYLAARNDESTLNTLDAVLAFAEKNDESKYPLAKRVLFEAYKCFDYVEAKRIVNEYRYQRMLDSADTLANANIA